MKNLKNKKKYWYAIDVYVCVICGRETKYKERVYDENLKGTNYYEEACGCHF